MQRTEIFVFVTTSVIAIFTSVGNGNPVEAPLAWLNLDGTCFVGVPEITCTLGYFTNYDPPAPPASWDKETIHSWTLTSEDIGQTFFISTQTGPEFDVMTSVLTNGKIDALLFELPTIGYIIRESDLQRAPGVDLHFSGYDLTKIGLTVNSLAFSGFDDIPNLPGWWLVHPPEVLYGLTLTVWGIPEPATFLLLGFGGLAFLKKRGA